MQGEGEMTQTRGKAVLDALRRPEATPVAPKTEAAEPAKPAIDMQKLAELGAAPVKPEEPKPAAEVDADAEAKAKEEANAKLSKLNK
jgi:hypothetical protein